jgi:ubiquinone/menaquinone biosynthesis C-methylase UbiE
MLSINPCEKLIQGSATMLPFKDNSFDIVFCSGLLHHVKGPIDVILEMKRVSNKYVVLCEPNRNNPLMALFAAIVPEERGALKFSLEYMKKAAKKCGLNIIDSCSMGAIAPNKTPISMLELFKIIDVKMPLGFDNLVISCK